MIDFALSEEEELIRSDAEGFARAPLRPRERDHERNGVPGVTLQASAGLGFALLDIPEPLGGQGLGMFAQCLVLDALVHDDAGAAFALDGFGPARYVAAELPEDQALAQRAPFRAQLERRAALFMDWERPLVITGGRVTGTIQWVPAGRVELLALVQGGAAYRVTEGLRVVARCCPGGARRGLELTFAARLRLTRVSSFT